MVGTNDQDPLSDQVDDRRSGGKPGVTLSVSHRGGENRSHGVGTWTGMGVFRGADSLCQVVST